MTGGADQLKNDLIEKCVQRIHDRLEPKRAKVVERFLRIFYANVPPDDLIAEIPDNLYGAALSMFGFIQQRDPGLAKVRVYNPRLEEHGWKSSHTVVEIVNDDMPFLVDSVTAELNERDAEVHLVIHPIADVQRDDTGKLTSLRSEGDGSKGAARESIMHVLISEQPNEHMAELGAGLERVLADVRLAVRDWQPMRECCQAIIDGLKESPPALPEDEVSEGVDFLKWLVDDHFTFLGYRTYSFTGKGAKAAVEVQADSGLGILRDEQVLIFDGLRTMGKQPPVVRDFLKQPQLLRITKSNRKSTVHRPVHLDTIAVKIFDKSGAPAGEHLFVGLFTSVAYSRSPREIPLLRHKVDAMVARAGFAASSHDGKALMHILETYPRDELFQISADELFETSMGILHLQERQRVALFVRRDPFERFVSCLVYAPRDRYDSNLRMRFQKILSEAYGGEITSFTTQLSEAVLARLHITIATTPGAVPDVDISTLEELLVDAARSWTDRLEEALIDAQGEERGIRNLRRYAKAFPASYEENFNEHAAVFDLDRIEEALASGTLAMNLYHPIEAADHQVRFKIYRAGSPIHLSDILPMLENMGFKVVGEVPYDIWPAGRDEPVWIHDFEMFTEDGSAIELGAVKDTFHDAFRRVWQGDMENDGFNKLVVHAGLTSRQVIVLRGYCKYLRQARIPFSQAYMEETLKGNPEITRCLVKLFEARFDPAGQHDGPAGAEVEAKRLLGEIETYLEQVSNLDEDRIIRRFLNVILTTLRTNFYQSAEDGEPKSYVSFKLDARNIDELPLPRPFREIFVYSPRVEGVHLRFGKVARGGLRWSDRREDFRTEILGLVKAQQVKNAVIVPVGSKGGFVVKRPPGPEAGREAVLEEGIACYRTFISGLLDLTDNLKAGDVVPPPDVVRHDEDDPYLVVAADKGTATFSDIANGVSQDYGFWLDDAFASGGSAGYDHKKMGITAKGAWESVKRHFRERGKDIQSDDFTCIGCGDMSGDVFGNGMLLSKHIKLVGAFNHMHIFVDPDPDPAASWEERKRLFDLPRSAWSDYKAELISKGGGVFERRAKSIKLTPEMQALFALSEERVTPNELVSAMLRAPVELLWFGGIGTYIKASFETHADAGDRANDGVRVDGNQVAAKVIGEGANLGMTQRGRIEFDMTGGHCNTDSIDNSAGVDCSDHEVNIKILLGDVEQAGDMTRKQRDKLLVKMTDEVAELVLRDNYLQSQAITVTHQFGAHLLDRLARYMRSLEKEGRLNRAIEYLPDDEVLIERTNRGEGLARPELAVLLSYSKIQLYDELLASDLPDDRFMEALLVDYFPTALRKAYKKEIARHRLRREIIATIVTNSIVNRVGITFVHEVKEKTGLPSGDIARGYVVSREIFGIRELWREIEELDNKVPASLQAIMLAECGRLVERATVWLLREAGLPLNIERAIAEYGDGVRVIVENLGTMVSQADNALLAERASGYVDQGVPEALAMRVASLGILSPACDIVRIAESAKIPVEQAGEAYFTIGARFGFDWLRRAAGHLPTDTAWDKLAVTAIIDDLFGHQGELTTRVLSTTENGPSPEMVDDWAQARRPLIARAEQLIAELRASGNPDLAMLAVANRQLKSLVAS
ncbi:MAG: NAD-glutamate dehydrogenase [Kiloniellales bacterium]|nr:NAD-glutamate dehydrogenase [Kiloniellales bacterium]